MEKYNKKFFLGANSCEGFVSSFKESYDANLGFKCYIIKGGPGTGKSSFMKRIAKRANKLGIETILCPCSSDPNSLDAVILPSLKTVILDGTSPHTVDPGYPAVCEEILNFGEFWKKEKFKNPAEIIEVTNRNKSLHKTASNYIVAAGKLLLDNYKTAAACTDKQNAINFAEKLYKTYIPETHGVSKEWTRYLLSITPNGLVYLGERGNFTQNTVIIEDNFGFAATVILDTIRKKALNSGHEIITLKNGLLPSYILDGIIFPTLNLSFIREDKLCKTDLENRRIHARRFTKNSLLNKSRERIKFNNKAAKELLSSATDTLKEAKSTHDILENFYISAMDFEALNLFTEKFMKDLFNAY